MSRKRRKTKKSQSSPKRRSSPSLGRRRNGWLVLFALALVVGAFGAWWLSPPKVVFPPLDLASMEPQVAAKIEDRMAAVRASPRSGEAWGGLAEALLAHGLDKESVPAFEKAVELSPDELRWQYLLVHALRSFDSEAALVQSAKAIAVDPEYSPAYVVRAELLEQQNDTGGALEHYEKARELDPSSPMALFGVARLTLAGGDAGEALPLLERAREMDPEAGAIHASLAQAYRRVGDMGRAADEARLAFERKDPVAIPDPIHFAMRRESVSSLAQLGRAMEALNAGDFARGADMLEDLVELRPDDADMHSRYGDALSQLGQMARAKEEYLAALSINAEHASALYGLANALNMEGLYDEAEARYREALELRPDHPPTLVNLASLVAFKGDVEGAEQMLERCLEIEPGDFSCHRQLGEIYLSEGKNERAVVSFRAALVSQPDFGPVHASLAVALARRGQFQDAWSEVEKAQANGGDLPPRFIEGLKAQLR